MSARRKRGQPPLGGRDQLINKGMELFLCGSRFKEKMQLNQTSVVVKILKNSKISPVICRIFYSPLEMWHMVQCRSLLAQMIPCRFEPEVADRSSNQYGDFSNAFQSLIVL